jgi:hypothetical protein
MNDGKGVFIMENKMPERIRLIVEWLMANEQLIQYSNTIKVRLDIKGVDVKGEVTILPDIKK